MLCCAKDCHAIPRFACYAMLYVLCFVLLHLAILPYVVLLLWRGMLHCVVVRCFVLAIVLFLEGVDVKLLGLCLPCRCCHGCCYAVASAAVIA